LRAKISRIGLTEYNPTQIHSNVSLKKKHTP